LGEALRGSNRREVGQYANCAGSGSPGGICKDFVASVFAGIDLRRRDRAGKRLERSRCVAEALGAPVWAAPASERTPFPENHSPYLRRIALRTRPLSEKLKGHDVALVIGAPVFRYYTYAPGPYLPAGLRLLHISDDPAETARAPVGDSLIGDAVLTLVGLTALMADYKPKAAKPAAKVAPHPPSAEMRSSDGRLSAAQVFAALNEIRPTNTVLVEESPSNLSDLHKAWPTNEPNTFYTFASGGLGWNLPASVGVALAERDSGRNRPARSSAMVHFSIRFNRFGAPRSCIFPC
jgi:benzoylformate decarboxylase